MRGGTQHKEAQTASRSRAAPSMACLAGNVVRFGGHAGACGGAGWHGLRVVGSLGVCGTPDHAPVMHGACRWWDSVDIRLNGARGGGPCSHPPADDSGWATPFVSALSAGVAALRVPPGVGPTPAG
jgi:hypothetical protein